MTVIYLTGLSHTYVCPCVDNKIIDDKYSVHMKNAEDRRRGGGTRIARTHSGRPRVVGVRTAGTGRPAEASSSTVLPSHLLTNSSVCN
jgi:hypothetical protein